MPWIDPDGNLKDPETWKNTGNEHFSRGDYQLAIECYAHAIELNPNYIDAWNNLGYALLKSGKIEEAKQIDNKIKQLKANTQISADSNIISKQKIEDSSFVKIRGELYYAGIWDREIAYLIDTFIAVIICVPIIILGGETYLITIPIAILIYWFYFAIFEGSSLQATPGKKILKLFVTTDDLNRLSYKHSIARSFLKILLTLTPLSLLTLINGIAASSSSRSKGLHDSIAKTLVLTTKITDKKLNGSIDRKKSLTKWHILLIAVVVIIFLIVMAAVIAAFIFGLAGTTQTDESNVYSPSSPVPLSVCPSPNIMCNGICYGPCSKGYYLGDDCSCIPEGTFRCGDVACDNAASCCNGKCYVKCPTGYFRAMDCACYEEGGTVWVPAK